MADLNEGSTTAEVFTTAGNQPPFIGKETTSLKFTDNAADDVFPMTINTADFSKGLTTLKIQNNNNGGDANQPPVIDVGSVGNQSQITEAKL